MSVKIDSIIGGRKVLLDFILYFFALNEVFILVDDKAKSVSTPPRTYIIGIAGEKTQSFLRFQNNTSKMHLLRVLMQQDLHSIKKVYGSHSPILSHGFRQGVDTCGFYDHCKCLLEILFH